MPQVQHFLYTAANSKDQHIQGVLPPRYRFVCGIQAFNRLRWSRSIISLCSRLLILLLLPLVPVAAGAASVTLAWDANYPSPDGYLLFVRKAGQSYNYSNPAWQGKASQCTIDQLADGQTYCAVARAFVGGVQSGDSNEVTFTAPSASSTTPANQTPVSDAGSDQAVSAGINVILNGSASKDPDGSIVAYQWVQTGGQSVSLKSGGTARASFTAPNIASTSKLTFQLKVTDNQGLTDVDSCQVTVLPTAPVDSDSDGLSDTDELTLYHTDPYDPDTDGDGVNDGAEVSAGTDPTIANPASTGDKIWLEAEDGNIDIPMQIDGDANASEGGFLWVPQGDGNQMSPSSKAGLATYTFNIGVSGTYRVWGRVIAPTASDDSFYVSLDGGAYEVWDTAHGTSWTWDLVNSRNGADPLLFQLAAGTHTLTLMQREDGTKIDRILITSDAQYVPQGQGEGMSQNTGAGANTAIEAEIGTITSPMLVQNDTTASSGACIGVPQGGGNQMSPSSNAGLAKYTFNVGVSGTYRIWGRVLAPTDGDDSFYVSVDGGAYEIWDTARGTSWTWDLVNARNGADPRLFQLAAGTHTLTLMQREDGTKVDRILITSDAQYTPQDQSQGVSQDTAGGANIVIESESGTVTSPMLVQNDTTASSGAFLGVPQGGGNQMSPSSKAGLAKYTFNISVSGTYRIWGRVIAPTDSDDSFYVSMDGGAYEIWDTARGTSWTWDLVNARSGADPLLFQLTAGTHTLTLMQREDGTKIDKFIITSDSNFIP